MKGVALQKKSKKVFLVHLQHKIYTICMAKNYVSYMIEKLWMSNFQHMKLCGISSFVNGIRYFSHRLS